MNDKHAIIVEILCLRRIAMQMSDKDAFEDCGIAAEDIEVKISNEDDTQALVCKSLAALMVFDQDVHINVQQKIVVTTEDRICRHLYRWQREQRGQEWQAWASVLVALGIVFPSSGFRDWLLPKENWAAVFSILVLICVLGLGRSLMLTAKSPSIEEAIKEIIENK